MYVLVSLKLCLFIPKLWGRNLPNPVQYFYNNKYLSYQAEQL